MPGAKFLSSGASVRIRFVSVPFVMPRSCDAVLHEPVLVASPSVQRDGPSNCSHYKKVPAVVRCTVRLADPDAVAQ